MRSARRGRETRTRAERERERGREEERARDDRRRARAARQLLRSATTLSFKSASAWRGVALARRRGGGRDSHRSAVKSKGAKRARNSAVAAVSASVLLAHVFQERRSGQASRRQRTSRPNWMGWRTPAGTLCSRRAKGAEAASVAAVMARTTAIAATPAPDAAALAAASAAAARHHTAPTARPQLQSITHSAQRPLAAPTGIPGETAWGGRTSRCGLG